MRHTALWAGVVMGVAARSWAAGAEARAELQEVPRHPSQILVRFAAGKGDGELGALRAKAGVVETLVKYRLVPGLECVRVEGGGMDAALAILRADPAVVYAEADVVMRADVQNTPYGISMVSAPGCWADGGDTAVARGSGAVVAVLDTGVDETHPDLPAPILSASFIAGEAVDDLHAHGTHCSGTVLARDNSDGVVGVAPAAQLMIGKVLANSGYSSGGSVLAGVDWAVANGADVISMSLGGSGFSQAFADGVLAANAAGVTVVAAAGNDSSSAPHYPSSYPGVISVAAVDSGQVRASFSNFGPTVSVCAPGVGVESTVPQITIGATWGSVFHTAGTLTGGAGRDVTGQAIYCGQGLVAGDFPAGVSGNIAHIRRGGDTFGNKAQRAIDAGAIGVIISNSAGGVFSGSLGGPFAIPVIAISQTDGNALQAASGVVTSITFAKTGHTYAFFSGTSMACPHVAGAAALLYSAFGSSMTPALVREALEATAFDLGDPGRDDFFGHGRIDVQAARAYAAGQVACVADVDDGNGTGTPDGGVTIDDLIYYLGLFEVGDVEADVDDGSGTGVHDGGVTIDDLLYYLSRFEAGC